MPCDQCEQAPCVCQRSLTAQKPDSHWSVRECESPDCHVMIREPRSFVGSRFCKWCTARGVTVTYEQLNDEQTLPALTPCLTKEEFGVELFETIKLFAGREWIQQEYARLCTDLSVLVAEKKRRLADLKAREQDLTSRITDALSNLNPDDVRRLLARYETAVARVAS